MQKFLESRPCLTVRRMKEHGDETGVLAGLCASISVACLLTQGRVFFPFSELTSTWV